MLAEAGEEAVIVRRENAKRVGEEAGTKLLFPMIVLLGVVMFIVIVPALCRWGCNKHIREAGRPDGSVKGRLGKRMAGQSVKSPAARQRMKGGGERCGTVDRILVR